VAALIDDYGEARRGAGLAGPRVIYEIWASDATGTWTIMAVRPDGLACLIATGRHWFAAIPTMPGSHTGLQIPGGGGTPSSDTRPGVPPRSVLLPDRRGGGSSLSRGPVSARALRPDPDRVRPILSGKSR